jgi:hypothetical protein
MPQREAPDRQRNRDDDEGEHNHDGERIDPEDGVKLMAQPIHQFRIHGLGMVEHDGDEGPHRDQSPPRGTAAGVR